MTRAQTVDVLNDSTTLQSRIDTVLAAPDLDWANDSRWQPGDPLYDHPWDWGSDSSQYVRRMVEVIEEPDRAMRCAACEVSWAGPEACWLCGDPATERAEGVTFGNIVLDETHDWADWNARMAEAMRPVVEQMGRMAEQFAEMQARLHFRISNEGQIFRLAAPEPEPEPAIRLPEGAKITPVMEHDLPTLTLAPARPDLYRPHAERFHLNRPVTETRRPRRTA